MQCVTAEKQSNSFKVTRYDETKEKGSWLTDSQSKRKPKIGFISSIHILFNDHNGPVNVISVLIASACSEDSGECARMRTLA